jgi:hypothetical protein
MHTRFVTRTTLAVSCAVFLTLAAGAKEPMPRGGVRFVGEISLIPKNHVGMWRIASRQVTSDVMTEIVAMSAPILVGSCAQVDMWHEKVVKIETLRPDEC